MSHMGTFGRKGAHELLIALDAAKGRYDRCFLYLAFLLLATSLSGCAGTLVSGRPVYPGGWPSLEPSRECPDLSGKYRALSDEAAPLVYPPGDHPRKMFFFLTYGNPEPAPTLGRRILPWHLSGSFPSEDHDAWSALIRYAANFESNTAYGPNAEAAWVQIQEQPDGAIEVSAGLHEDTLLSFVLRKEAQSLWTYKSHVCACKGNGLVIVGGFPPPSKENPSGRSSAVIGAVFTFYRANDGSLVALEEAYTGVSGGNMVFNKWWRWRRIE